MALTSISVQPQQQQEHSTASNVTNSAAALMGMLLALYVAHKGAREFRKLRRKLTLALLKNKIHSLFSRRADVSDRTLLYILLGALILALIIISPYWGLAVLALAILIILLVRGGRLTASKR
jgi:hypothetical protein